ncbi:hypothetical protein ARTHRO9V_280006 [Arthrobacter sp. 9V]|nr:hypothetical protein ARTHRO9V_280006 [Arthrobacter sp. 9V]
MLKQKQGLMAEPSAWRSPCSVSAPDYGQHAMQTRVGRVAAEPLGQKRGLSVAYLISSVRKRFDRSMFASP